MPPRHHDNADLPRSPRPTQRTGPRFRPVGLWRPKRTRVDSIAHPPASFVTRLKKPGSPTAVVEVVSSDSLEASEAPEPSPPPFRPLGLPKPRKFVSPLKGRIANLE